MPIDLNNVEVIHIKNLIHTRLNTLRVFLEPDMKDGWSANEVFVLQTEQTSLKTILNKLENK